MSVEDFPKVESKKEKTREELLEDFKKSLEDYGVEGVNVEMEDNELAIEQKCGEGIRGIGYDGKFWMCLGQGKDTESNPVVNEFQYNENTLASLESKFHGVTFEEAGEGKIKVQIDSKHPAVAMAKLLGDKEIQLRGINGWGNADPFEFNEENEKWEAEFDWNGKFKECKIMIRDIEEKEDKKVTKPMNIEWNGNYGEGDEQRMKIDLGEKNKE